ncbi:E3 ubiquitin-protein ligase ZNRF2-like [Apteryx mantelli]|uniref:E3 ubiquitin-protein ligase ZNRF2-like n=1 Tax=Apteryx mantelli TaxID=2696672 RepID=A0ABM4FW67_9AVES
MRHPLLSPFRAVAALLCLQQEGGTNGTGPGSLALAAPPGPPRLAGEGPALGSAAAASSALTCWRRGASANLQGLGDPTLEQGPAGTFAAGADARPRRKSHGLSKALPPSSSKGAPGSSCHHASGCLMLLLDHLYHSLILPACKVTSVLAAVTTNIHLAARCLKRYQRWRWSKERQLLTSALGGDTGYAECAICLGTFEQGEALKVLSCSHAYHGKCIDLWHRAQPRGKTCPLCLRRVTAVVLIPLRHAPRIRQEEEGGHEGKQE